MAAYRQVMTRATCRLTAKNWYQLRNTTLGNRVWATFFLPLGIWAPTEYMVPLAPLVCTLNGISIGSSIFARLALVANRQTVLLQ